MRWRQAAGLPPDFPNLPEVAMRAVYVAGYVLLLVCLALITAPLLSHAGPLPAWP